MHSAVANRDPVTLNSSRVEDRVKRAMLCMTRQCWEQGILAHALLETGDQERLELVVQDMVVRQSADGRLCNIESAPAVIDSAFCIGPTLFIGQQTGNQSYLEAARRNVDYLLHTARRTSDGVLLHMIDREEIWADSAAFLPAVLAQYGHVERSVAEMGGILRKLRDPETGMFFHMWDEASGSFSRRALWGIGNGWILTGLIRLYTALPETAETQRNEVAHWFGQLLDRMLACESPEHLFHDILDDPASFLESECSEMVAYAIYLGISAKLLGEKYRKRADSIRQAVGARVDENGFVQDCASSPDFVRPGISVEGQAHFLMMQQAAKGERISR